MAAVAPFEGGPNTSSSGASEGEIGTDTSGVDHSGIFTSAVNSDSDTSALGAAHTKDGNNTLNSTDPMNSKNQEVLEEAGSDYQPRHEELVEYARWLGVKPEVGAVLYKLKSVDTYLASAWIQPLTFTFPTLVFWSNLSGGKVKNWYQALVSFHMQLVPPTPRRTTTCCGSRARVCPRACPRTGSRVAQVGLAPHPRCFAVKTTNSFMTAGVVLVPKLTPPGSDKPPTLGRRAGVLLQLQLGGERVGPPVRRAVPRDGGGGAGEAARHAGGNHHQRERQRERQRQRRRKWRCCVHLGLYHGLARSVVGGR
jgi:hypothetical protein